VTLPAGRRLSRRRRRSRSLRRGQEEESKERPSMSQAPPPPPPGSDPRMPAPPPAAPPPGYYTQDRTPQSPGAAPAAGYGPPLRWRSLGGITTALTWLFGAHIVLSVLLIIGVFNHLRVLSDKETGGLGFGTKGVDERQPFSPAVIGV